MIGDKDLVAHRDGIVARIDDTTQGHPGISFMAADFGVAPAVRLVGGDVPCRAAVRENFDLHTAFQELMTAVSTFGEPSCLGPHRMG